MSKFAITGPNTLSGEIEVKGAKNSALKILPAALLSTEPLTIHNLPKIEDVQHALSLLADLGAVINQDGSDCRIEIKEIKQTALSSFANKLRASIVFTGP